ncbi:SDR family oxidoreductase [Haliangium sp.]|uniref:SDR family oxidoreductase n=1 Tax=Haliangium sp. TaxID=2663208 RepID=UPI003D0F1389
MSARDDGDRAGLGADNDGERTAGRGRLAGRVVLVTGASRGIGRATAARFAAEGAVVVAGYATAREQAEALVSEIEAGGGRAECARVDVRDGGALTALVADVTRRHGGIDVLVNNAGITRDTLTPAMADEDWDQVLAVNAGGAFRAARAVARPMMLARRGCIINLSSVAATKGGRGQANYAASKAALEGFTRALAVELAPRGIRVNAVAPGVIETDMSAQVRALGEAEALSKILLGRFGHADEVAGVIAFLASDEAAYITGAVIPVDGGFKMG